MKATRDEVQAFVLEGDCTVQSWLEDPERRERAIYRLKAWAAINQKEPRTFVFKTDDDIEIERWYYEPKTYAWCERGIMRGSYCDRCCKSDEPIDTETQLCLDCYGDRQP